MSDGKRLALIGAFVAVVVGVGLLLAYIYPKEDGPFKAEDIARCLNNGGNCKPTKTEGQY